MQPRASSFRGPVSDSIPLRASLHTRVLPSTRKAGRSERPQRIPFAWPTLRSLGASGLHCHFFCFGHGGSRHTCLVRSSAWSAPGPRHRWSIPSDPGRRQGRFLGGQSLRGRGASSCVASNPGFCMGCSWRRRRHRRLRTSGDFRRCDPGNLSSRGRRPRCRDCADSVAVAGVVTMIPHITTMGSAIACGLGVNTNCQGNRRGGQGGSSG